MKGQHSPSGGTRRVRDRDQNRDRPAGEDPGGRRARRSALRITLVLVGLVAVVLTFIAVRSFLDFEHAVRHPEGRFSDWQCAAESGTCGP